MRARILSSVLLPAPLRPMIPTVSPALISNETSLSAQKSRFGSLGLPAARARRSPAMSSRSDRYRPTPWVAPMR